MKEGDNARHIMFMMDIMGMPKFDIYAEDAAERLRKHWLRYQEICAEHDMVTSPPNFASSLHITLTRLKNMAEGRGKPVSKEVMEYLNEIFTYFNATIEDGMYQGNLDRIGTIFALKNHFGYKDQTEQVVVHHNSSLTANELKALAENLPDVIDGDYTEIPATSQIEDKDEDIH